MMSPPACPLTRRELEIVQLLSDGHSGPQVAVRLRLSGSTIRSHTQNIYSKLRVKSSSQAVLQCVRRGWVAGDTGDGELLAAYRAITRELIDAIESHREVTPAQKRYLDAFDRRPRGEAANLSDPLLRLLSDVGLSMGPRGLRARSITQDARERVESLCDVITEVIDGEAGGRPDPGDGAGLTAPIARRWHGSTENGSRRLRDS
jgi:DNA-binding CsgD family transcriptional regulator